MTAFRIPVTMLAALALSNQSLAYDLNDKLSINGLIAGAVQCQELSDTDAKDGCKGGLPLQLEATYQATDSDRFFLKAGLAAGNGLNNVSPFLIPAWAADLEDDVKEINGRNRNYLLTAWYQHTITFSSKNSVGLTLGLIDSTDYLDDNVYSNDEYTQFMNGALVNGPQSFLPSYDFGGAVEWDVGRWSLRGVYMNIGENDDRNNLNFLGAQAGYTLETSLGEGHYRVLAVGTSSDFLDPGGTNNEKRVSVSFSFDQQFGKVVGAFLRVGWQADDAAVDYDAIYSGGIDINGRAWGRGKDNIGLGYAYLSGGNLDVNKSYVAESYYRFVLNDHLALTADIQYMNDVVDENGAKGWIFGLRAVSEF